MGKLLAALSVLILLPSIAAAQWDGSSFGKNSVDTGHRDISVHARRGTSPLMVAIENKSQASVRCSATFSHMPVINETQSRTIAPGKTAALFNRNGYPTARIDVGVKCV